ncbi:MAG TPA: hypothetical protein VNS58_10555 [Puia sp.]|nr:hypothetical protein [Puia sp.]
MIKRSVIAVGLSMIVMGGFAQGHMPNRINTYSDEGPGTGFLKENLFVGGGLSLGYGSYDFNVGATPEIGYSLNKWLDAGLVVNINYSSERADINYNNDTRFRSFNYGAGLFGRVWPLPFLFFQAQPEFNFINYNEKYMGPGGGSYSQNTNAPSLLLGVGYGQRIVGQSNFFLSLSLDVLNSQYSPYRDFNGAALPVIRAGFDFYLHQRK